jgi:hypothetical protein
VVLALIAGGILLARRGRRGPAEQSGRS